MNDQEIRNRLIRKLLRKRVVGGHTKQITTVVNFALPSHARGRGKQLLEEMANDPDEPIEWYGGGHRNAVRLTGANDAVEYLKANGGDVPFGFE